MEDLRECLRYLFSVGVSCPSLTALTAFSAGAVPVGALCNTHPHMMQAVTLQVACGITGWFCLTSNVLTQFNTCSLRHLWSLCSGSISGCVGNYGGSEPTSDFRGQRRVGGPRETPPTQAVHLFLLPRSQHHSPGEEADNLKCFCQTLQTASIYPIQRGGIHSFTYGLFCDSMSSSTRRSCWQPTAMIPEFLWRVFSDTPPG